QPLAIPRTALRALRLRRSALGLGHHGLLGVGPARRGPVPPPRTHGRVRTSWWPGPAGGDRPRCSPRAAAEAGLRKSAVAALAVSDSATAPARAIGGRTPSRWIRAVVCSLWEDLPVSVGQRRCRRDAGP